MTKKTSRNVRLIFHEVLFALAIALFFTVLVMLAMGYRLRRHDEGGVFPSWERTALLRVGSFPTGANIILNGNDTGRRTTLSSQRLIISTGEHSLRVTRPGYHPWQNSFTAAEGEITWFDYIQLFPTNRIGDVIQTFNGASQVWHSPIGERALVITPATTAAHQRLHVLSFATANISSSSVQLPSSITTPDFIVWSRDEGLVLLCERKDPSLVLQPANARRNTTATDRCVLVDADRGRLSAINLPIRSDENLKDVTFINSRTMLVVTSSRAFLFDISTNTPQPLNVEIPTTDLPEHLAITANDITLLYHTRTVSTVQNGETTNTSTYHLSTVTANGTLTTIYTNEQPFEFAATRYLNDFVVTIANRYALRVYFSNSSSLFASINGLALQYTYDMPSVTSTIAARGRFITTSNGLALDLERDTLSHFENVCHDLTWQGLTSALLFCPNHDSLLIKDFDGTNHITLQLPNGVTMPAPIAPDTDDTRAAAFVMPATIVNRRTLYYWTFITTEAGATQLQLRQLRL